MTFGFLLGFGGSAGKAKEVTVSSILDTDSFAASAATGAGDVKVAKVRNDVYAYFADYASTGDLTVAAFAENGTISSISRAQSLTGMSFLTNESGICYIDDDKLLMISSATAVIVSVSGVTASTNVAVTLAANGGTPIRMSSTVALIPIRNGKFQIATITGTTISLSAEITAGGGYIAGSTVSAGRFSGYAYDSTHLFFARDTDDGSNPNVVVSHLTIDTGAPSVTEDSVVNSIHSSSGSSKLIQMVPISTTRVATITVSGVRIVDRASVVVSTPSTEFSVTSVDTPGIALRSTSQLLHFPTSSTFDVKVAVQKIDISGAGALSDAGDTLNFTLNASVGASMVAMNNGFFAMTFANGGANTFAHNLISVNVE